MRLLFCVFITDFFHLNRYNNKTYIIERINFEMNTESLFELNHGSERFDVSYYDYFSKRYNEVITQRKQPMIQARTCLPRRNEEADDVNYVYLVPELCHLVGMTDQMRLRKPIWREIKQVLKVDAPVKIQQMESLIDKIIQGEKAA
jgi:hypothetical protein